MPISISHQKKAYIEYDSKEISVEGLIKTIQKIGYGADIFNLEMAL